MIAEVGDDMKPCRLVLCPVGSDRACHSEERSDEESGVGRRFALGRVAWPHPPQILRGAQNDISQIYIDTVLASAVNEPTDDKHMAGIPALGGCRTGDVGLQPAGPRAVRSRIVSTP